MMTPSYFRPPADFPLNEFAAVIHNPVDGPVCQAGGGGILLGHGHHTLGRVHMPHLSPPAAAAKVAPPE